MTYLLQTSDCHLDMAGQYKTVDVLLKVPKGVKFVSFKLSAPDDEMKYNIENFAQPSWAKEVIVTTTPYTQTKNGYTVYREYVITLAVNESSALYNTMSELVFHAGTFFISGWNSGTTRLVISPVEQVFSGQINSYAIVNVDNTGAHTYDITCNSGVFSEGAATEVIITNITANKTVVVPNEEVTYTAVYTGTQGIFSWEFGANIIPVSDMNSSSVTVKYTMPSNVTVVCRAYNSASSSSFVKTNITTVNAPTVIGTNETVSITPNDDMVIALGEIFAPVTLSFVAEYTGMPVETWFKVTDYWESVDYAIFNNTNQIEYTFTVGKTHKVFFYAKYSDEVTKVASVEIPIKFVTPTIEDIVLSPWPIGVPANISWDASAVAGLENITSYVWEIAKDGNFSTDPPPAPNTLLPIPVGAPYPKTVYPFFDRGNYYDLHNAGMPGNGTIVGPQGGNPNAIDEPGLFSVKLHAWSDDGYEEYTYSTHIFHINTVFLGEYVPIPDFTYVGTKKGNAPLTVTLDCGAIDYSEREVWDFGDGSALLENTDRVNTAVSHIYTAPGVYPVTVTCYNATTAPDGISLKKTDYVTVTDPLIPVPTVHVVSPEYSVDYNAYTSALAPHVVTFNFLDVLNCDTLKIYNQHNTLLATLTEPFPFTELTITEDTTFHYVGIKGAIQQTYTAPYEVTVFSPPNATISVTGKTEPIEIGVGETLEFIGTTDVTITSWLWTFGDGTTSTLQNPTHSYLSDGVFSLTLTVTNPAGSKLISKPNYITVGAGTALDGDFSADDTAHNVASNPNVDVEFTFSGTLLETNDYIFDFGDGEMGVLTSETITHTYSKFGDFPVTLTIIDKDSGVNRVITKSQYIMIRQVIAPVTDFEVVQGVTTVDGKCSVNFIMRCTGTTPRYYIVDFGDGSGRVRYEAQIPEGGFDPLELSKPLLPFPGCTQLPTDPDGDGLYEDLNGNGRADFADVTLFWNNMTWIVENQPIEAFDYNGNGRIDFQDQITLWNMLGRSINRVDNSTITHVYQNVGRYTVTVEAHNEYGFTSETKIDCVVVALADNGLPNPLINVIPSYDPATPLRGAVPLTIQFLYQDTSIASETVTSWTWNFGDGNTSNQKNPMYTYIYPGIYNVTLKVGTSRGLTYFSETHLVVEARMLYDSSVENVTPDFTTAYTHVTNPTTVKFYSTSTGAPTKFAWLFGDEPYGTQFPALAEDDGIVEHTYATSGVYTVRMKAWNILGDAICTKVNYIVVSEPSVDVSSAVMCEINTIGDIFVQTINGIDTEGTNEIKRVDNKNTLDSYVYSIPSIIENFNISGTIYAAEKTEDEYAEDIESVRFRSGAYNYISLAGKRGFLEVGSVSIPKDADSAGMRDYTLNCNFMSASLFERAYTIETDLYNSVINGVKYTVDHPPTIALPVNAYNVKIKSPWQTVPLKEPTYVMSSSEGKIPIYTPFKLYTTEDPSFATYGPNTNNIVVTKTLEQYGYGKITLPPLDNGASYGVTWNVLVGVDIPMGKYKVAMKVGIRDANNNKTPNTPAGFAFDCVGYSLTNNTTRVASSPAPHYKGVTYDGIYYSDELDFTNFNERMEMHIVNPRVDTNLEIQYIYLVPTYHARVAFDAPTEYYAGETKVYDYYNGSAQRVYNVNHEFRGVIYISNPFMRWIINPKQVWHKSSDITHTKYIRTDRSQIRNYGIDDPNSKGIKLYPLAFNNTYPNVIIKKILPNIVEMEIGCEEGIESANAQTSRMTTTVHVTPYAFKFYVNPIGDFKYHWTLESTNDDSKFQYSYGNLMCRYGDNSDNYTQGGTYSTSTIPSIMTDHGSYLYMLSFYDLMDCYISALGSNITFPMQNRKGSYQFTLNAMPMIMDNNYDYSDDLICVDDSMQRKYNGSMSNKEINVTDDVDGDAGAFWNLFEVRDGYTDDVAVAADRFTVSHTNQYAKGNTQTKLMIQNKEFSHFRMDFDLSMTMPNANYSPDMTIKFFESTNKETFYYLLIKARATDNVSFYIVGPGYPNGYVKYTKTVDLNLLTGGTDHVSLIEEQQKSEGVYRNTVVINGETIFNFGNNMLTECISPISFLFNMMYGCSITVKDAIIRPYLATEQKFTNSELDTRYFKYGSVTASSYMGTTAMMLSNGATAMLKSYKMLSGQYVFRVAKPASGNTNLLIYLSANVGTSAPYNMLYITIPSGGGTMQLKRQMENGDVVVLASASVTAMTPDTSYDISVDMNDVTRGIMVYYKGVGMSTIVSEVHFKYGNIGFVSSAGSIGILGYSLCGHEKFGRGPQVRKYMDDFDYGPKNSTYPYSNKLFLLEYNDGKETGFLQHMSTGTVVDRGEVINNPFRVLYPNTVNPMYGKVRVMLKSTRTTVGTKRVGVITNVTSFTSNNTPVGGYGVFLNFATQQLEVVMFNYTAAVIKDPTVIYKMPFDILVIEDNMLYEMTVERISGAFNISVSDGLGRSQSFIVPLGFTGMNNYNVNGIFGLATWSSAEDYGVMFDDFTIEDIVYNDSKISFVTLGGVSHGGEYDKDSKVYDKVLPGVTIPYGYYYMVANAHTTTDQSQVFFSIKNFEKNTGIILASFDGGEVTSTTMVDFIGKTTMPFARYVVKMEQASYNDECGIEIAASYQDSEFFSNDYTPTVFINYIIMIPLSGVIGKQIFLHELEMINRSSTIVHRRLEKKKIS